MKPLREQRTRPATDEARAAALLRAAGAGDSSPEMKARIWRAVERGETRYAAPAPGWLPAAVTAVLLLVATAVAGATVGRAWIERLWGAPESSNRPSNPPAPRHGATGTGPHSPRSATTDPAVAVPITPSPAPPIAPSPAPPIAPSPAAPIAPSPAAPIAPSPAAPIEPRARGGSDPARAYAARNPAAMPPSPARPSPEPAVSPAPPSAPRAPLPLPTASAIDPGTERGPVGATPAPPSSTAAASRSESRVPPDEDDDSPAGAPVIRPPSIEALTPAARSLLYDAMRALRRERNAAEALRLLEQYRALHPTEMVGEALAVGFEAAASLGDARAGRFASEYLAKYPSGKFAEVARAVLRRFPRAASDPRTP